MWGATDMSDLRSRPVVLRQLITVMICNCTLDIPSPGYTRVYPEPRVYPIKETIVHSNQKRLYASART